MYMFSSRRPAFGLWRVKTVCCGLIVLVLVQGGGFCQGIKPRSPNQSISGPGGSPGYITLTFLRERSTSTSGNRVCAAYCCCCSAGHRIECFDRSMPRSWIPGIVRHIEGVLPSISRHPRVCFADAERKASHLGQIMYR